MIRQEPNAPLDIGACLPKSTVALESIGQLPLRLMDTAPIGINTFHSGSSGSGIVAHFLTGVDTGGAPVIHSLMSKGVEHYEESEKNISESYVIHSLTELPSSPFIGKLSYRNVTNILGQQRKWFSKPEHRLIDNLSEYVNFKLSQLKTSNGHGHG